MIANGEFFKQPLLLEAMERGRARNLHLLGLLSDGGVHSHIQHLFALLRMAREQHVERVFVHCFLMAATRRHIAASNSSNNCKAENAQTGCGRIALAHRPLLRHGRDNRWERVDRAYRAIIHGDSPVKTAKSCRSRPTQLRKGRHG